MTNIEWTDETWNPVVGCSRVSAGCDHCYAVAMTRRLEGMSKAPGNRGRMREYVGLTIKQKPASGLDWHFNGTVRCVETALGIPMRWRTPRRVFVNSMSDLFHERVPFEFVDRVFATMAACPQHTFQILTKRPERMAEYLTRREISKAWTPCVRAGDGGDDSAKWKTPCDRVYGIARLVGGREAAPSLIWPLPNVWLGTSIENQDSADERIPHLIECPAKVRFLSMEPLLGPVDLHAVPWKSGGMAAKGWSGVLPVKEEPDDFVYFNQKDAIQWVIVGGESGPKARPCDVAWIRSIVAQCNEAGVPCFVKQLGAAPTENGARLVLADRKGGNPAEWPDDLRVRQFPGGAA